MIRQPDQVMPERIVYWYRNIHLNMPASSCGHFTYIVNKQYNKINLKRIKIAKDLVSAQFPQLAAGLVPWYSTRYWYRIVDSTHCLTILQFQTKTETDITETETETVQGLCIMNDPSKIGRPTQ